MSPFAAKTRKGNTRQLHSTDLVLAYSLAFDVIEFYRKLVAASKPSEIDLIPFASFDPACALWPSNRCAEVIFEMNDALALHLDQTGTLNLEDETIHILYQKHIIDSTSGVRTYAFLHALLKKVKRQMREKMPTPPDIDHATSIGSFGSNLDKYYLQLGTIGFAFDEKTQSRFFLSALQQKGIEIDRFVDRLDNVPDKDPLPEELTLIELILRIKDIRSLNNSPPAIINRFTHSAPDSSSPHRHDPPPRQPHNPDALSDPCRQAGSETHNARSNQRPARPFSERTQTQCICGRWGYSVENCQQIAMHFLIVKYLRDDKNDASATQISERWRLAHEQYSRSAPATVRALRNLTPADWGTQTYEEIMETLYDEDEAV
jgi:hypothetical protein